MMICLGSYILQYPFSVFSVIDFFEITLNVQSCIYIYFIQRQKAKLGLPNVKIELILSFSTFSTILTSLFYHIKKPINLCLKMRCVVTFVLEWLPTLCLKQL